jgi:hypothetical protein
MKTYGLFSTKVTEALEAEEKAWAEDLKIEPNLSKDGLVNWLFEADTVSEKPTSGQRWWTNTEKVVRLPKTGTLIRFSGATTTGDDSPYDKGWVLDLSTVAVVVGVDKTIVVTEYYEVL